MALPVSITMRLGASRRVKRQAWSLVGALAAWFVVILAATAHSYRLGDIAIGHFWTAPTAAGVSTTSVYGPMLNRGKNAVRLLKVSTPVAAAAHLRAADGTDVEDLSLAPGKPLALAAWRTHIELDGLKRPLRAGESFDLMLDFGPAGHLPIKVMVEAGPSD